MIPNFILRTRSRKAIKPVMQVLLVIALVASLPGLLSSTVTLVTQANPMALLADFTLDANELLTNMEGMAPEEVGKQATEIMTGLADSTRAYMQGKAFIYLAVTVASAVLTPALAMSVYHALLRAIRGQEVGFAMVWPGWKRFFKGIGVHWLMGLLVFLWMLPGLVVAVASLAYMLENLASPVGTFGYTLGIGAMLWMGVRAAYGYMMAPVMVADDPERKLLATLKESRKVMHGKRMLLFSLEASFIGWALLVNLGQSLVEGLFGVVIGMTLGMFCTLFVQVYRDGAIVAFYEAYVVKGVKPGQVVLDEGPNLTDEE